MVAGTVHKFDATFKFNNLCEHLAQKSTTCSNFSILEGLASAENCQEGCLDVLKPDEVSCTYQDQVEVEEDTSVIFPVVG